MARAQADRIVREFRKLQKKIDVVFTERDPYQSFEQMKADILANRRMFVYTGASETPLWTPEINWMARAVHDWDHLVADVDFSVPGELAAYRYTAARAPQLAPLYLSEIALQAAASSLLGGFPTGAQKFVFVPEEVEKLARNPKIDEKRLVRSAADMLDFMTETELMVHLASIGLTQKQAVRVALAAQIMNRTLE